ncbi:MAG: response regulator [Actinomycetota bacterium]
MPELRVLIADDHPIVLEGLQAALGRIDGVVVVGAALNGAEAVELAAIRLPDVVIIDLRMPVMDGVESIKHILSARPEVAVLVLTMYDDEELLQAALKAGARGFLLKGASQEGIARALAAVAAGDAFFGSGVADNVLVFLTTRKSGALAFPELTAREREILELLAGGLGYQQLARKLFISPKTVRNHVANILAKLQLPDRTQAIVAAREAGLGRDAQER